MFGSSQGVLDTKYDRAKVPPENGNLLFPPPIKQSDVSLPTEGEHLNPDRVHRVFRFVFFSVRKGFAIWIRDYPFFWECSSLSALAFNAGKEDGRELRRGNMTFKTARNCWLLMQELLNPEILLNLGCDNKATITMLDEPSWRTRYLSKYRETIRREVLQKSLIVTFVTTDVQLADPLTKPTTTRINDNLLPLLGQVAYNCATAMFKRWGSQRGEDDDHNELCQCKIESPEGNNQRT